MSSSGIHEIELTNGFNIRGILCPKHQEIIQCVIPAEKTIGKCLGRDISPFLDIAKKFINDFCILQGDGKLPAKIQCMNKKISEVENCSSPFATSFIGKEKSGGKCSFGNTNDQ